MLILRNISKSKNNLCTFVIQWLMFDFVGKRVHFIGIGGISCNALAKFVLDFGGSVSGSDRKITPLCEDIRIRGADIWQGEIPQRVKADMVVFSSAIKDDNKELIWARNKGISIYERHEFLAEVSKLFGTSVAIAGTHGKTSTTAMLTHILKNKGFPFVSMIGGECVDGANYVNNTYASNVNQLKNYIFVCEACEYKEHMLSLKSDIGAITNIECDHPDCYKDLESVKSAFDKFVQNCKITVAECGENGDNDYCVGYKDNRLSMRLTSDGASVFDNGKYIGDLRLKDDGEYNYHNALFAIAIARLLGVKCQDSIKSLLDYRGVKRRFERCADVGGVPIIFDFAHHPTEIMQAIKRAEKYGDVLAIFQPHTYSRTQAYLEDFAFALTSNDCVKALGIMPTYAARETLSMGVNSDILAKTIFDKFHKVDVVLLKNAQSTVDFVKNNALRHDIVLMLGAGDIYDLRNEFSD